MKRILVLFMLAAFFRTPCFAQEAQLPVSAYEPTDMAYLGTGRFAFAADDCVLIYKDGAIAHRIECPGARYCAAADGELFILCESGAQTQICRYDGQYQLSETKGIGSVGKITGFAAAENVLAVSVFDEIMYENYLYTLDLQTGELLWREEYTSVSDLTGDGQRFLYRCFDGFSDSLTVLDPADDIPETAMEYPPYGAPVLVPGQDRCTLLAGESLEMISWSQTQNTQRSYRADLGASPYLSAADERGLYIFDTAMDEMLFYPHDAWTDPQKKTLTLGFLGSSGDAYLDSAVEYFSLLYPEYSIEKRVCRDASRMFPELMSASSDVDVIFIPDYWYATTAPSGVYADLRAFACIDDMEASGDYLEWPFSLGQSPDGALYLMPAEGEGTTWAVNEEMLERCGLDLPDENWTWQDLLDMGRAAKESDGGAYIIDIYGTQCMIYQYALEHVDPFSGMVAFDTDLFRELLTIYQALYAEDLVEPGDSYGRSIFSGSARLLQDGYAEECAYLFQPRMRAEDAPVAGFIGQMMGVYSVSDSPEAAAQFIAAYYAYPLHAQESGVDCSAYYPMFYADFSANEESPALQKSGAAGEVVLRTVAAHYAAVRPTGGMESVLGKTFSILMQLRNGEITIDAAVSEIQREVDMRINE